jgi:DNA-binding NtrC family response regulator
VELHKRNLLIVDDEPDILFSLAGLLRREFQVYTAGSAREGLQIMADHPIQVVMSDQRMPEMTGVELLGLAKARHPDAVRIIFTGYADLRAVVEGINTAALYRYITKPWDPDDLIDLLHEAAAYYDEQLERKQVLVDVRDHLTRVHADESSDRIELCADGNRLLARLDNLIGSALTCR